MWHCGARQVPVPLVQWAPRTQPHRPRWCQHSLLVEMLVSFPPLGPILQKRNPQTSELRAAGAAPTPSGGPLPPQPPKEGQMPLQGSFFTPLLCAVAAGGEGGPGSLRGQWEAAEA